MNVKELLNDKSRNIHIIGGGGVGMSGLALLLQQLGHKVTASDLVDSKYLKLLSKNKIETWSGSYPEHISSDSIIFCSTAISEHDPERRYAQDNQLPVFSRHPLIEYITQQFFTISVTGTHGKTTTTAWLTFLLENAGMDPCALVGGTVSHWNANFRLGKGNYQGKPLLIMEADESDKSFLSIDTSLAAITNIEMDHPDHYQDMQELEQHFERFFDSLIQQEKKILLSSELYQHPLIKKKQQESLKAFFMPSNFSINSLDHSLSYNGEIYHPSLLGEHNLKNAGLICALSEYLEIQAPILKKTLEQFEGVHRRLQKLASFKISIFQQLDIIDDYAHHPTEIEAILKTLSQYYQHLVLIWEPHRISRFLYFRKEFTFILQKFLQNLSSSSKVYSMPLYFAGEKKQDFPLFEKEFKYFEKEFEKLDMQMFGNLLEHLKQIANLKQEQKQKTALVFLGAGLSSKEAHRCVRELERFYEKTK